MSFIAAALLLLQAPADDAQEPLTTALAVREQSPAVAAAKRPVRLTGVVTHGNPGINDFFIQDESAGIYVMPSEHGADLLAGDHVEVEGFSNPGTFAPCVTPSAVRRLGRKALPEPEITDLRIRERNWLDGQYVQLWVNIREIRAAGDFTHLVGATAHGLAVLVVPGAEDGSMKDFKGRTVRARGVCAVAHDPRTRLATSHVRVFVQSAAELRAAPYAQPNPEPIRIDEVLRGFSHLPMATARPVTIAGVVTARTDKDTVTIQDETGGALLSGISSKVQVGDEVVATGFLTPGRAGVHLLYATTRQTGDGVLPDAVSISAAQAWAEKRFGQRLRVEGTVERVQPDSGMLYLHDGPTRFLVTLPAPTETPDVPEGAQLGITGVAVPIHDEEDAPARGLRIHCADGAQIELVRLPPKPVWWTAERVGGLGLGFLGILTIGLLWVFLLRRQVRKQAAIITTNFQREAELAESLRQARKLEAIGRLAGGIAHDFNNLLTVIIGNTTLATDTLGSSHPANEHIEAISSAGQRAAELTRQLLSFSRQQAVKLAPLDLNAVVGDAEKLLQRLIGEHIQLTVVRTAQLPNVLADASLIHQILLNLAANARDAMPKGGELTIRTSLEKTAGSTRLVRLTIKDTGCGMSPETQTRLFEPFFTTKDIGKGTGLGLAAVYGAVKTLQGTIEVESHLGQGTTIMIDLLPHGSIDETPRVPSAVPPRGGRAVVMLVDDDDGVRAMCKKALEMYGYDVLAFDRPEAALEAVRTTTRPIELLVSDMIMPSMNGRELADGIRALKPNLRVLFMSGYPEEEVERMVGGLSAAELIRKPFTPIDLATRVHEMLDKTSTSVVRVPRLTTT